MIVIIIINLFLTKFILIINPHMFYRLKEVADKINRYGFVTPPALSGLKASVKKIVVGPSHIALLLDDNRICRVAFTVLYDRLDLRKNEPSRKYVDIFIHIQFYFGFIFIQI